ncbi:kinase-like protein [Stereum hirsutum FP-91666 SS1]|uniref:kinase-like protein n=1 Tax=Stereum hirsutum (strain FP-91666) TaxID=721885 RepID=UPI000444A26A|nr:kinase-like protein [Stereum hirsutum FP-91666 SS1]EIM86297.1 kinase-like protein [Stereum hirsutum FP-91666 SS1]
MSEYRNVRPTNVLLRRPFGDHAIEKYFSENPLKIYGEVELPHDGAGERYPVWATQALPRDIPRDTTPMQAELFGAYLVDYGQCRFVGSPPAGDIVTHYTLRAPELMLDVSYGTKVDVWAVGCLVFELLTGESLFDPKSFNGGDDTGTGNRKLDDAHLAQMMDLWGEQLSAAFLDKSAIRSQFFNEHGDLLRKPRRHMQTIEACLAACAHLRPKPGDVEQIASFVRECTRLDPVQSATASELTIHPWMVDAYMVGSTYPVF